MEKQLKIRTTEKEHADFRTLATLKGVTVTALIKGMLEEELQKEMIRKVNAEIWLGALNKSELLTLHDFISKHPQMFHNTLELKTEINKAQALLHIESHGDNYPTPEENLKPACHPITGVPFKTIGEVE